MMRRECKQLERNKSREACSTRLLKISTITQHSLVLRRKKIKWLSKTRSSRALKNLPTSLKEYLVGTRSHRFLSPSKEFMIWPRKFKMEKRSQNTRNKSQPSIANSNLRPIAKARNQLLYRKLLLKSKMMMLRKFRLSSSKRKVSLEINK